ncbi:TPA: aminotransferase class III-fold pyridoxal phosphate-dependent enzyme, partial [Candidatus Poribacteria bacterium]|nr:aminotransferase class III-fold pyridoxal phosphate-dependent enzyme [Candidatus Poribacteria bacterium]
MQTLDSIRQKVEDAYAKREALLKMPVSVLPEKELADQSVDYFEKTGKSKSLFEKAKRYFPDGIQHHNTYVSPYPLFMKEARGSKVFDVEGNAYLDFTMGAGAQLFGYASEHYDQAWQTLATDRFPLFHHQEELELAEKINSFMPSVESIKFFQSGTEAVKAAIRL